jgi:hypothetical protein
MDLQKSIIAEFKKAYPEITLKKASQVLGIQITRVFRLFNGHEMRLVEYEKFKKVLTEDNSNQQVNLEGLSRNESDEVESIVSQFCRWNLYRSC